MLSRVRDSVRTWIKKIAKPFARAGLSPNHITVIALLVGILGGLLFYWQKAWLAGVVILLGGFFDVIDGAVARLTGRVTRFGGVLDSVFDRITDAVLYIGVLAGGLGSLLGEPEWILPVFALLGSMLVSYVRARAESAGSGKLDVGIAERAERLLILAIGAFLNLVPFALLIIVVLTFFTVIQRVWEARLRLT
ncbi:hypothetical protein AKJ39_03095 [candidate division MSBL1 archaeon SCGC-AAA259J03]|uniref:Archaetidylinositol phosphate synthase n=2 Tax=candidate division MSBL1 TaxID=215777 RepID=A0A656YW76_9EURY|nr:hypothetical protein AKJ36_00530 [candidate division MSBL1 archaeon SCGC-AAA259I07]KXA97640.1 hypothetical protein AKJ39_03095 [candidate division MSBL1 archaeon SCGC-AAA259J03]